MIDFSELCVGDFVKVEYTGGTWSKGARLSGTLTRIWTPSEHRAGIWQGEVNGGWCFHADDKLLQHERRAESVSCSDS